MQDARKERAKAYGLIISGFDPAQEKKKRKALQKEQMMAMKKDFQQREPT